MADQFSGIRLKLWRAADEFYALNKEITDFIKTPPHPYRPAVDFNINTRIITLSVHVEKSPDPMWGIRIGEIVHNLRSALDHIVWELVILATGKPPSLPSKNQFPIFETEVGFSNNGIRQLDAVSQGAVQLIRAEQPYSTREQSKSPLLHLRELSNADKHRTICVVGTLVHGYTLAMPPLLEDLERIDVLEQIQDGPIQQDAVLYRGRVVGGRLPYPFAQGNTTGTLSTNIAFDQSTPVVGGWLAMATLADVIARTSNIAKGIAHKCFDIDITLPDGWPVEGHT